MAWTREDEFQSPRGSDIRVDGAIRALSSSNYFIDNNTRGRRRFLREIEGYSANQTPINARTVWGSFASHVLSESRYSIAELLRISGIPGMAGIIGNIEELGRQYRAHGSKSEFAKALRPINSLLSVDRARRDQQRDIEEDEENEFVADDDRRSEDEIHREMHAQLMGHLRAALPQNRARATVQRYERRLTSFALEAASKIGTAAHADPSRRYEHSYAQPDDSDTSRAIYNMQEAWRAHAELTPSAAAATDAASKDYAERLTSLMHDASDPFRRSLSIIFGQGAVGEREQDHPYTAQEAAVIADRMMRDGARIESHDELRQLQAMAAKRNPSSGLIEQCQINWEHYLARPCKKRLKAVLDHLEVMKSSKSAKVRQERRRCLRVANQEASELEQAMKKLRRRLRERK